MKKAKNRLEDLLSGRGSVYYMKFSQKIAKHSSLQQKDLKKKWLNDWFSSRGTANLAIPDEDEYMDDFISEHLLTRSRMFRLCTIWWGICVGLILFVEGLRSLIQGLGNISITATTLIGFIALIGVVFLYFVVQKSTNHGEITVIAAIILMEIIPTPTMFNVSFFQLTPLLAILIGSLIAGSIIWLNRTHLS